MYAEGYFGDGCLQIIINCTRTVLTTKLATKRRDIWYRPKSYMKTNKHRNQKNSYKIYGPNDDDNDNKAVPKRAQTCALPLLCNRDLEINLVT